MSVPEISAKERRKLIVAYAEVVREREEAQVATQQVGQADPPVKGTRHSHAGNQPGLATKVARELGVSKRTVTRSLAEAEPKASAAEPPRPTVPADLAALRRAWAAQP